MPKILCDICGADMEFVCRLKTKKTWLMRRYRCKIDPDHQRTIVTNNNDEVNLFMRKVGLDLAKKFKQEIENREII
jgi:hypothetical protein